MLVLTSKPGQKIRINRDVVVTVTQISQGRVRLGFEAPDHVAIVRTELDERDERKAQAEEQPV